MKKVDLLDKREPIAVIGMGCRYPGNSNSPDEFWRILLNKTDAIVDIPLDRWNKEAYFHPESKVKGKMITKQGGFIKDIDKFDASFFGIPPIEANRMDPQQRLLLEQTYMAIEDAGLKLEDVSNSKTGVFVGISTQEYSGIQTDYFSRNNIDTHTNTGGALSIAANRISYIFNLRGPSFAVDTACSSSLVALHLACQSIWNNESEMAFTCGASAILKPEIQIGFSTAGFLSPDCRCKSFDASANGYIRSEGTGVVILKPLRKAIKDGDRVYGAILGSGLNEDGRTTGIAMPNGNAQKDLLRSVYKKAGISGNQVNYIEAHGTGTAIGDPTEANSIGKTLCSHRKEDLYVGSVKSNVGHLESASGMIGFSKLMLTLQNRIIPPNIHFNTPNPLIDFEKYKIKIPTAPVKWDSDKKIIAGINSFGFGGANSHVITSSVERNELPKQKTQKSKEPLIFSISAQSEVALKKSIENYIKYISTDKPDFVDLCYSSVVRRSLHNFGLTMSVNSNDQILANLNSYLEGAKNDDVIDEKKFLPERNKTVFLFSGQGPQWHAMGRSLLKSNKTFKNSIKKINSILKKLKWLEGKSDLVSELLKDESKSRMAETIVAQPSIFAIQVGIAEILMGKGLKPDAVVGHSIGELAAAYISGALSLDEAVRIVYNRSKYQANLTGKGRMLACALSKEEFSSYRNNFEKIDIAALNGRKMLTLAGNEESLKKLAASLEKKEIFHRFINVDIPFHCYLMDEIKNGFLSSLGKVKCKKNSVPFYSTVLGKRIAGKQLDTNYWYSNIRKPVSFQPSIKKLINDKHNVFIEISSHPILSRHIEEELKFESLKGVVCETLRRDKDDNLTLSMLFSKLYASGYTLKLKSLYPKTAEYIKLPLYPWQKERYWLESECAEKWRIGTTSHPHFIQKVNSAVSNNSVVWDIELDHRSQKYIQDHKVQGPIVYPGAGHVELAITAGLDIHGNNKLMLENIRFDNPLFLPDKGEPYCVQLSMFSELGRYAISSKKSISDKNWNIHSTGFISDSNTGILPKDHISLSKLKNRIKNPINAPEMLDKLKNDGLLLGPSFRGLTGLWESEGESLGKITVPEELLFDYTHFNIHPALLDASFQTAFGIIENKGNFGVHIPIKIARVIFHKRITGRTIWSYAKSIGKSTDLLKTNIYIFNEKGELSLEIKGFEAKYLKGSKKESEYNVDDLLYEYKWFMEDNHLQQSRRKTAAFFPKLSELDKPLEKIVDEIKSSKRDHSFRNNFTPLLYELSYNFIVDGLKGLGIEFTAGNELDPKKLFKELAISKKHEKLFYQLFNSLTDAKILHKSDNNFVVNNFPAPRSNKDIANILRKKHSEFMPEVELVIRCGEQLSSILKGEIDPLSLLFPEDDWHTTTEYYTKSYSFLKYNKILAKAISEIISKLPENRTLRILEIGAGTGGVTKSILPILPAERTEYYFTDVSSQFLAKAQNALRKYPFVKYETLNIEPPQNTQSLLEHSFDIIIASDVIHATKNLNNTLNNVKKLLADNGIFCMLEVTTLPPYVDLVFGLTEGWWLFEDHNIRPDQCTLSINKWIDVLSQNDFTEISPVSDVNDNRGFGQTCFFAKAPNANSEIKPVKVSDKPLWLCINSNEGALSDEVEYLGGVIENITAESSLEKKLAKHSKNINFKGIIFYPRQCSTDKDINLEDQTKQLSELLTCVKAIHKQWDHDFPPIWIITSQAQKVLEADILKSIHISGTTVCPPRLNKSRNFQKMDLSEYTINLNHAAIWGLARVLVNEPPFIPTHIVDMPEKATEQDYKHLAEELILSLKNSSPEEIAFRNGCRYLNRMIKSTQPYSDELTEKNVAKGTSIEPSFRQPNSLNSTFFSKKQTPSEDNNHIIIENHYAPLNFRDVMVGTGNLPESAINDGLFKNKIGLEFAGEIISYGKKVKKFKIGDLVYGFASGSLNGQIVANSNHTFKIPVNLTLLEASSLPMAYITAYYSLVKSANIEAEDKLLIHAAAGGVGIAAINIAKYYGAEIICTASRKKHKFLKSMGIKHVFDSHSTEYCNQILELTNGKGVDIILNSLSGKHITQSLKCLAPFGKFIEIGKKDLNSGSQLDMSLLRKNQSFIVIDIDRMLKEKPEAIKKCFDEMNPLFAKNSLPPLPCNLYKVSNFKKAFSDFSTSKNIGKTILDLNDTIPISKKKKIKLNDNSSYIVVGGTSGFGLATAEFLSEKGAKHLHLISRSGINKQHTDTTIIDNMRQNGCKVSIHNCDVTNYKNIKELISLINSQNPVKGIFHSAMVLEDALLPNLNENMIANVLKPKLEGAWNLHKATLKYDLDYFVLYSSVASMFGTPGQGNYAAANAFLDQLSYYRNSLNLPSITMNWGVLDDIGFVSRNDNIKNILKSQGLIPISTKLAKKVLNYLLIEKPSQSGIFVVDWNKVKEAFPKSDSSNRFSNLLKFSSNISVDSNNNENLTEKLNNLDDTKKKELIEASLKEIVSNILDMKPENIDSSLSITSLGMDSLMLNQLRTAITKNFDVDLPLMIIMQGPSIIDLTNEIDNNLGTSPETTNKPVINFDPKWIITNKKSLNSNFRLFCFPYMGAGASAFTKFQDHMDNNIDVCPIQLPGREERINEQAFSSSKALFEELDKCILPLANKPFAFYGHSFGANIAFSYAVYLKLNHNLTPKALFLGASIPSDIKNPLDSALKNNSKNNSINPKNLSDNNIIQLLKKLQVPDSYFTDKNHLKSMIPTIRNDLCLAKGKTYISNMKATCPIIMFAGKDDPIYSLKLQEKWKNHTEKSFKTIPLEGNHLFIHNNNALKTIKHEILKLL